MALCRKLLSFGRSYGSIITPFRAGRASGTGKKPGFGSQVDKTGISKIQEAKQG
jgi:hypothetical protein